MSLHKLQLTPHQRKMDMSFKTQAEIYQFLINGAKIRHPSYCKKQYIHLVDGNLCGSDGVAWQEYFGNPSEWSLHEEPKKVTLYRYTYEKYGEVTQTEWSTCHKFPESKKILKTETKEVEV